MNDQKLNQLKKVYLNSNNQINVDDSWRVISGLLPEQDLPTTSGFNFSYLFAGLVLFLLIGGLGVLGLAQSAKPGEALYSVRVASDNVVSKVLGKPQIKLEKRTEDIMKSASQSAKQLKKATSEYKKALDDAGNEVKKDDQEIDEINRSLQKQEQQLKQVESNAKTPEVKGIMQKAVEEAQKAQDDTRGQSSEHKPENPGNSNSDNSNSDNSNKQKNK